MKRTYNAKLWEILAAAAIMVTAGCQSTSRPAQPITQTAPNPVESEAVVSNERPVRAEEGLQTVYFEFNRWELSDESRRALRSNAQRLQANPEQNAVTVTGHCDERGSEEYNLALGERRAAAVKQYLADLGVPATRIRTVSFGESSPAVSGEGEAAWSRNRRAELIVGTQQASR